MEEMLVPVSSRRSLENASPGVFNQDHWVVTVRSYRGLCLCHANRAHGSMCTVLKRNPGKPPGKCPNCARSDLKLFFSEKINLPGFRFQNITCRFFCVCVFVYMATVLLPKLFTCKHSFMTCGKRESFVLSAWLTQNPEGQGEWRRSPPQRPR